MPFDWDTSWRTSALFPQQCKGIFEPPSSWGLALACQQQLFSPSGWALPLLETVPGKEGAPRIFEQTRACGWGPLDHTGTWTARYPKVAKSDPGPEAVNTTLSCFTAGLFRAFAALATLQGGGAASLTNPFGLETLFQKVAPEPGSQGTRQLSHKQCRIGSWEMGFSCSSGFSSEQALGLHL